MLNRAEKEALMLEIIATAGVMGHLLTPEAALMMANDLAKFDQPVLAKALARVRAESSGRLVLKTIIDRVEEQFGRLAPNEAWALAVKAKDERETVVWTNEIAQAWGTASAMLGSDKVGARMAFLDAYGRIVRESRELGRAPVIQVSEGHDVDLRKHAIEAAQASGLLTAEAAAKFLHLKAPVDPTVLALMAPADKRKDDVDDPVPMPAETKERLDEIRRQSLDADARRQAEKDAKHEQELQDELAVWNKKRHEQAELARRYTLGAPPKINDV